VSDLVRIAPEVAAALAEGRPVVALETTLVSHGFPHGEGASVARVCEARVRASGAVPATVGVVEGAVRVGLDDAELALFAESPDARKAGPRDLAACAAQRALGATTVGGTLAVCRTVGIRFLGTGGLGGVHRGFAETLDVSADLAQVARTQALVVASGAKSILDVSATAEALEALGVPVVGWRTDELPLFYRAYGGPPASARVDAADEAAALAHLHWELGGAGLVLAAPPAESLDVEPLIEEAIQEAERQRIRGQDVTPFVLARLHEASGGKTVEVNKRLVEDNAALAAEVAVAYHARGGAA
jgi:pseudouridine-5'-phosphate glycosidase